MSVYSVQVQKVSSVLLISILTFLSRASVNKMAATIYSHYDMCTLPYLLPYSVLQNVYLSKKNLFSVTKKIFLAIS